MVYGWFLPMLSIVWYNLLNSLYIFRGGEFMTEYNLGKWHHILDGQGKTFTINGLHVAMFNIDGELFAFEDECPHV